MSFPRKNNFRFLAATIAALLCCPSILFAGETVIKSAEEKVIMDFSEGLNIPDGDTLKLVYTGSNNNPSALLRDISGNASYWGGNFWSNYNVVFVNTHGITFGDKANIQSASLIASTLNIANNDFLNGKYNFYKETGVDGYVVNKGKISTNVPGGYICLLSPQIDNQFEIEAKLGTIVLASGNKMTLALDDLNQISVVVSEAAQDGLVGADGKKIAIRNGEKGIITADGGKVIITAKVLNNVFDQSFNNAGVIRARSLANHDGKVSLEVEGAPAVNIGKIEAGDVQVKANDTGFVNKGSIITDGVKELPNGGNVSIEAKTVLQQGVISANAAEQGTAGVVEIVSQDSTDLDDTSSTEARAMGLVGNGGRIVVNSKKGNTVVNKNAVVDVSAGTVAGNGGYIDVSAYKQLGLYGVLNGRAPPGYRVGTAIIDPTDAHLGFATFGLNTTVWATNNIYIDGNITLASGVTLNLYADHKSATPYDWEDGVGAIINSGSYTIAAASGATNTFLNIIANSGIGTNSNPIRTNVHRLSAETDTSGNIYIVQGTTDLIVGNVLAPKGDVFLTAGGSILDDSSATEFLTGVDTNGDGTDDLWIPTCFFGNNVTLNVSGNIGSLGVEGSSGYPNPMIDVGLGSGTLHATAGGNIYIMALGTMTGGVINPNVLSSKYVLNTTTINKELGLGAYNGNLTIDQAYSGNGSVGFGAINGNLNINANIVTSGSFIKLFADNNINIAANLSSSNIVGLIKITADSDQNGVGAINQTAGTVGSGSEALILSAAQGINLTATQVAKLQATNTTSGNIAITNTGTVTLTDLDGSLADGETYSIWNKPGTGSVSITALGAGADIILNDGPMAEGVNGNITLIAGRDIKSNDVNTWLFSNADVLLQAARDISMTANYWIVSGKLANGLITLTAGRNIGIGNVQFRDDVADHPISAGTIKMTAGGAVTQLSPTTTHISSDQLLVYAAMGINLLSTNVLKLQATNTTSGDIVIVNAGTLTLSDLDGSLAYGETYSIWNKPGTGSVSITALGAGADIILNDGPMAEGVNGNISLIAGRDIKSNDVDTWLFSNADVLLQAARDISMTPRYWIVSGKLADGLITLTAGRNIGVGFVQFRDDIADHPIQAGRIKMISGGAITQFASGGGFIVSDQLILSAAQGIDLHSAYVLRLQAKNTASGDIIIALNSTVTLTNLDGSTINGGPLYAILNEGSGSVTITAWGSDADILMAGLDTPLGTGIVVANGNISLVAGRDIKSVNSYLGSIWDNAGDVLLQAARDIAFYYRIESCKLTNGLIELVAGRDIGVKTINFLDASENPTQAGTIKLTSGGAITQVTGGDPIVSEKLLVSAALGINLPNTHVSKVQATNTTSGDINITNIGTLTLTTLDNTKLPATDPYEDNTYYSIWNAGIGNVYINATGVNADIIGNAFGSSLCAIRAKGNVTVTAGRDIILGDGLNNKFADIYTDAGDLTMTAGRDILQYGTGCWLGSDKNNGTITLNAGRDVRPVTVGFYLDDSFIGGRNGGTVTITAGRDILDDSTTAEVLDGSYPTLIRANNINLTAGGNIGAMNNDGNTIQESLAGLIDIYLGSGKLTASAGGSLYVQDFKPVGLVFDSTRYQLNAKDPSTTDYNEIIFGNLGGSLTINSSLNLADNFHFGAVGDIIVNAPVTSSAGALGFHATKDLYINADITLNGSKNYNPDDGTLDFPEIDLEADIDLDGVGNVNVGAVTVKITKGGDMWIDGSDIVINSSAVIDAKGDGTNADSEIAIDSSVGSKNIFLGAGVPGGFSGMVLDQADLNTFKASRVQIGDIWNGTYGDIKIGTLTLDPSNVSTLKLNTQGRILNNSASSLLRVANLEIQALGWIGGNSANLSPSAIGEASGTGFGPLKINVDAITYARSDYWNSSVLVSKNKMYLSEADDINVKDVIADVFDLTAGGSITVGSIVGDTAVNLTAGGAIVMARESVIDAHGHDVSLSAGAASTVGTINNVNLLTLSSSSGADVMFTSNPASLFSVTTLKTNYHSIFTRIVGSGTLANPIMIYSVSNAPGGLQYIPTYGLGLYYQQANNIDAAETSSWNAGAGFIPIGSNAAKFSGNFYGWVFSISNLYINSPTDGVGLFGYTSSTSYILNAHLTGVNVTGHKYVGGLVGNNIGSVGNSYVLGSVNGAGSSDVWDIGGLVGLNKGIISGSYFIGNVNGGSISDSVGGLVGRNYRDSVSNSYGSIFDSYAKGTVTGGSHVGGLLGGNDGVSGGSVRVINSYSTCIVSGTQYVGGLVGFNSSNFSSIANSYATGTVTGSTLAGGLAGANEGTITNSYFTDGTHNNGLGTYEAGGMSAFYAPSHAVYNAGSGNSWDFFTPAWNAYTNELPRLYFENYAGTGGNIYTVWKGTTSTNWSTASNWVGGVLPGPASNLFIGARTYNPLANDMILGANMAIGSGAILTMGSNSLRVSSLNNNGTLVLTLTGLSAQDKVYNGLLGASLIGTPALGAVVQINGINGVLTGTATGSFLSKAVGSGKAVAISGLTLTGVSLGNYTLTPLVSLSAGITPKVLTVTATGVNKVYDGNTNATVTLSDNRVAGDVFTDNYAAAIFTDKNVGTGKTINVSGISLTGSDAGNYTFNTTATATANITALVLKTLIVSAVGVNKVYDGNTIAVVTLSDNRVAGDIFTDSYATASFADKNAGMGKTINVGGISISGPDAANYTFNTTATATANITPRTITVTATGINKVYDGNGSATATLLLNNKVGGDDIAASYSASFVDKSAGNGKAISVTGIGLSGADAVNYSLNNTTASSTANITPKALTVNGITAGNKVYDGNTAAAINVGGASLVGVIAGDAAFLNSGVVSGTFDTKSAGNSKPVAVSGLTLTGADASNYTINATAATTANITPLALTGNITAGNKAYDGNNAASILTRTLTGVIGTDAVSYVGGTAVFNDQNAAMGKTVTGTGFSLSGSDAGNYTVNTTASTSANITPFVLTGNITAGNKVYDGNNTATILTRTLTGVIGTDVVNYVGGTASFNNKSASVGKTVTGTGLSLSGAAAGNYTVNTTASTIANVIPLDLTGNITAGNKVYDGNSAATILTRTLTGVIGTDVVNYVGGTASFSNKSADVGKVVTGTGLSLSGTDAGNYTVNTTASTSANITPLAITGNITVGNKVYDGNSAASILTRTLTGVIGGDVVNYVGGAALFNDKNASVGKAVTGTGLSLSGTDAGNYTVNTTASTLANITPFALTGNITAGNKVYDGNNTATILTRTLTGVIGTDVVNYVGGTAAFIDKNANTGKVVTGTGLSLSGADAGNYTVNTTASTNANITPLAITGNITAGNKVYDGNSAASILTRTLTGVIGSDAVNYVGGTASFGDKSANTGKTVTGTGLSLSGADAGNYIVNTTASTTANITPLAITGNITVGNKVYDGNSAASILTRTLTGVIGTDVVNYVGGAALFNDKNASVGKAVTGTGLSLFGADAGNYTVNTTASTIANITPLALTGNITAGNKVYDGNNTANILTRTLTGVIGTDAVNYVGGTATFIDKNATTGKTVTGTGFSLSGSDADNYTVNTTASTTANITPLAITGNITAGNKVYDGNTSATILTRTLTGVIGGDVVGYVGGTASFGDKNVDTGKTVTGTGFSLSGSDAGNYTVNTTASTTANVTPLALTGNITAGNKVYDGNNTATILTRTLTGVIGTDAVNYVGGTASFGDKNVNTGKVVTGTGLSLSGADATNYTVNTTASTTANITPLALTGNITAGNKVYDGNSTATILTRTLTGVIGADVVNYVGGTAAFIDKNANTGKVVTGTGLSLSGADAGNYTVNTTASTNANITPLAITGNITAGNKVYDGNSTATILTRTLTGVIGTDVVNYVGGTAAFIDKNANTGKVVTGTGLSLSGADATNYAVNTTASTTANITPLALTGNITAGNKVYDGNSTATILTRSLTGVIGTDAINYVGGTALFGDKNANTGKTVTGTGLTLSGADAGNYTVNATASTTANVSPFALTGNITASNKVYDGNNTATILTRSLAGVIGTDAVNYVGGTASFNDKNVNTGKVIAGTGLSLSGADATNYTVNTTASTTANITPLAITGNITAGNKVYDGNNTATILTRTLINVIGTDAVNYVGGTASFNDKNANAGKAVTGTGLSLSGTDAGNYTVNTTASTVASITPKALTVSGVTATNKVYDGNNAATINVVGATLVGVVGGDDAALSNGVAVGTFDTKNAGDGKTVAVSGLTLAGIDANNYTINSTAATTANITKATLNVTATGIDKVYNGNSVATVNLSNNKIGADDITTSYSAAFDNKNVGTGKVVSVAGISLGGADAGNYIVNTTASTTANVTPLAITGNITAGNKVYDGNNTATILTRTLTGVIGTDVVNYVGGTAAFIDKNANTGKTVTGTGLSLSGADAANYTVNTTASTTANVTPLAITGNITAGNKVYDGNSSATILTRTLTGVIGTDVVNYIGGTALFNDKNASVGKAVTGTGLSLSGADAGNYTVNTTASTTANVTPLALTGNITAGNKVYDGNNTATILTRTLTGVIGTDSVSYVGGTAVFNDKNANTGKAVTGTGLGLSGIDAGNYTVNTAASTTANVTPLALTGNITAGNKVYDGNNTATILTRTLTGVIGADVVSFVGGTASFDDKNVNTGKVVSATGLSLSGAGAGNYTVNTIASTTANVTPLAITGNITAGNKVYDGNNTATILTRTLTGVIGADIVDYVGGTASFNDKNANTGKVVTGTGLSLFGADAANYTVNTTASTTANVTPLAITGNITAGNKVYDGNNTATILTRTLTGVIGLDVVNYVGGAAVFNDKNANVGKAVTGTGLSLAGADAGNYTVNATASTTANITPFALTGNITAGNKVYDGNSTATILTRTLTGVIGADVVNYVGGTASFNDKNANGGKAVTGTGLSLSGADAGNYTVNATASTTANVTPLALTGNISAGNKVYDGNNTATILTRTLTGVIGTDAVSYVGGAAVFNDKNVNTGKAVTGTGFSLSGTDASNYTVNTTASTTANVTPFVLTGNITAGNKVYDGNNTANILTRTLTGVIGTDVVNYVGGVASFIDKNANTGKVVTGTGLSLSGADAGNYTVNTTASTTANVTALAITGNITAGDKIYDGSNTAAILTRTLTGVIGSDVVNYIGGAAVFNDKNVNAGKTVTGTGFSLSGTDAGNYSVNATAVTTANVTPKALTVTATGENKIYDGSAIATVTLADNRVAGDILTDSAASALFNDKNAAIGKAVSVTGISITGADAGNYTLGNTTALTTANVTPKALTVSGVTATNKVYDGNNTAAINVSGAALVGVVGGDIAILSNVVAVGTFDTKNAGNGKAVAVSGLTLSGADASNYTINATAATTANITPFALTGNITAGNKVYDGNNSATILTRTLTGVIGSDVVNYVGGTASFNDKNAITGKAVTGTGLSLFGADAANYTVNTTASTTANVTPFALTGNITAGNKVYDGNNSATILTRTLTGVIGTDVVNYVGGAAVFNDKNANVGKSVTGTGLSLSGADASNYSVNTTASTTANVTPFSLSGNITAGNKVYDGNNTASILTRTLTGVIGTDVVNYVGGVASFNDKNANVGKAVTATGLSLSGADAANYTVNTTASTTANVTPFALTGNITAGNKVYDGNNSATILTRTLTGVIGTDAVNYVGGAAAFSDKNASVGKTITATGLSLSGADASNYSVNTTASTMANVTPFALTGNITAGNKVYDGNNTATILTRTLTGVIGTDVVNYVGGTAVFNDKNASIGKAVTGLGLSLSGADAGNYTVNTTASTTANVTPFALTGNITAGDKVYDGNSTATILTRTLIGVIGFDVVNYVGGTASFNDKNANTGKPVTGTGLSLSGVDAGNYTVNATASATANVTPKVLTVTATGVNKVYDGNAVASVALLDNRVTGDVLADNYIGAAFNDKNAANGKVVSVTGIGISGIDAGNYTLGNTTASTTANVTPKALTVSGVTASDKVYDGNTTAAIDVSGVALAGFIGGDDAALSVGAASGAFDNKNAGDGKSVVISGLALTGMDANNYTINTTAATTARITPRALAVSATGVDKVYDGNAIAAVHLTDNRVAGDVFTDNAASALFNDKNATNGKVVSVTGISITGTDAGNYALSNTTALTTANVTPKVLTVTATGVNKVYDGNTIAAVTLTDNRVAGDILTDNIVGALFSDKNVANGKAVNVTGISITGFDAGNYLLGNATAVTSANVTPLAITGNITAGNKVYDGNNTATILTRTLTGVIGTDAVNYVGGAAVFNDKNVNTGKAVIGTGFSLSGADAGNYTVNTTASTTANVTPLAITGNITAGNKVYDGNNTATILTRTLTGVIGTDIVNYVGGTALFNDKNASVGKTVTGTGLSLSGADAGNYTVNTTASTTANVTPFALTGNITAGNKVYDGNNSATILTRTLTGVIGTDVVNYVGGAAVFNDKNANAGKVVTGTGLSLSGTDAGNYTVNATASTAANVTPKTLTVTATGSDKVYDGNAIAAVTLTDNRVAGDVLTDSFASAIFSDKNAANGKLVSVSGISIGGTDAANYILSNTIATATANVTPRTLTVTATGVDKVYDGNVTAVVTLADNRVAGDVLTDSLVSAIFSDKNAANGKSVNVAGITIGGADASNYTLGNTTATTTANVTPKALTVSGITASDKEYDGNNTAMINISGAALVGMVGGDDIAMNIGSGVGSFDNKNAGNGKAVAVSGLTFTGADANNYTINSSAATTANVTPKVLTVSGVTANKVYDGTDVATLNISGAALVGVVGGDAITLNIGSGTGTFDTKNVGVGKTVTGLVPELSISGSDAGNYSLTQPTITNANIAAKALTVTGITASNKVFDGTNTATINVTGAALVGVVGTEVVTLNTSGATGAFVDTSVGTGKNVSVSGLSISGIDMGNYLLTQPTIIADVTAKPPTVSTNTTSQLSVFATPRFQFPGQNELATYRVNTFSPMSPVYFYHPLVNIDSSAFEHFTLEEGAYEFINNKINIVGHAGFLPFLR